MKVPGVLYACLLALPAVPGAQAPLCAQAQVATLTITVADPSGSVVPNASVLVIDKSSRIERRAASGASGLAALNGLPAGRYTVIVAKSGFASSTVDDVAVEGTAPVALTVSMTVAGRSEQISVDAASTSYAVSRLSSTSHLDTPLLETPQNIVSVSSELLADQQATDISGVLGNVSGLSQSTPNPFIRPDFYIRGFLADRNKLRNGVGGFTVAPYEDTAIIDHVEFIKGPAGFLLANAEPGGVLNIITKAPVKDQQTEVSLLLGTDSLYRGTLDTGGSLGTSRKLYYRFNGAANRERTVTKYFGFDRYVAAPVIAYDQTLRVICSSNTTSPMDRVSVEPIRRCRALTAPTSICRTTSSSRTTRCRTAM